MIRFVALALVVTGCAKQNAKQAEPAPAPAPAPASAPAAPEPAAISAKDQARSQGLLGPTDTDAFGPIEGGGGAQTAQRAKGRSVERETGAPAPLRATPASVTLDTAVLDGGVDGSAVTAALSKRTRDLEACYKAARARVPALSGELSISFTVQPDGRLASVSTSSASIENPALDRCVVGVVKTTTLEEPLGTAAIRGSVRMTLR